VNKPKVENPNHNFTERKMTQPKPVILSSESKNARLYYDVGNLWCNNLGFNPSNEQNERRI